MIRLLSVLLSLSVLVLPVQAADDLVTSRMVDEARTWSQKGRDDLAAQVWQRLLSVESRHPEALVKLGLIEARAGNLSQAQALHQRASQLANPPRGLKELSVALTTVPALATAPVPVPPVVKPEVKAVLVAPVPAPAPSPTQAKPKDSPPVQTPPASATSVNPNPNPNLKPNPAPSSSGDPWEETRRSLEQLARKHPKDAHHLTALAKHLALRETTRREAIRQLEALNSRGLGNSEIKTTWRTALLALTHRPGDEVLLTNYLSISPGSISINQRLKEVGGKAPRQAQGKTEKTSAGSSTGTAGPRADTTLKPDCGNASCK